VEVDGEVSDEELHFETFPEFYEMKAWLDKHIEPYEIEMVLCEGVGDDEL